MGRSLVSVDMRSVSSLVGTYVPRIVDQDLDELLRDFPAVLLDGPKAVGKTMTAERRSRTVRRLDDPMVAAIVRADPGVVAHDEPPVLLDEWQRICNLWDFVRRAADAGAPPASYLLTGSSPVPGTHSLAARIATLRMRPLCLAERLETQSTVSMQSLITGNKSELSGRSELVLSDYVDEIFSSGLPGIRKLEGQSAAQQIDDYIESITDHDLRESGYRVRGPENVRLWLTAYAAATSTTASWERIRAVANRGVDQKLAKSTTIRYVDLLTRLRILDPLQAWSPSLDHLTRLTVAPKHYLVDPALAVRLLQVSKKNLLSGEKLGEPVVNDGAFLGQMFESLAALTVRTTAQSVGAKVSHLRTRDGVHEVDFIVENDEGIVAIEAKVGVSTSPSDFKQLHWLRDQLGDRFIDGFVINTGAEAFRDSATGFGVVPLALLSR
jgi:predicted AAA+ superfamily ATPase